MKKTYGLIAFVILVCSLFGGLAVDPANASIVFSEQQITSDSAAQENPDIYEYGSRNYTIVWQDNRNGNWSVYMYNPWQPGEIRLTNSSGNDINPKICNDAIVYQSDRNGNWDIYMYNMTSKEETQITNNTGVQSNPAISGNTIVWQDNRNGHWDIYMYNLTTQAELGLPLSYSTHNPAISGNLLVYVKDVEAIGVNGEPTNYIEWFNFTNWQERSSNLDKGYLYSGQTMSWPSIEGINIAWQKWFAVYAYNGYTGATWSSGYGGTHPDIGGEGQYTYVVYEYTTTTRPPEIYMYELASGSVDRVTNNPASQLCPAISAKYGNYIVYMDNRNGNWDIYLTTFGFGLAAAGSKRQSTPSPSAENVPNSGNQELGMIVAAVIVVSVIGAATIITIKQRKPKTNA